jgi:DNA-binding response OmpR family regulator
MITVDTRSTGAEALRARKDQHLVMILVDAELGREGGFDVTERVYSDSGERCPIIVISEFPERGLRRRSGWPRRSRPGTGWQARLP